MSRKLNQGMPFVESGDQALTFSVSPRQAARTERKYAICTHGIRLYRQASSVLPLRVSGPEIRAGQASYHARHAGWTPPHYGAEGYKARCSFPILPTDEAVGRVFQAGRTVVMSLKGTCDA